MHNDNVYPNFGEPFVPSAPAAQEQSRQKKIEETFDQFPLLKQTVERLEKRIAFYDSVDSITVDIAADPLTFQKVHAANKLTRDNLKAEKDHLELRIKEAMKKVR